MDSSHNINHIIEDNYTTIISSVPFKDILIDLRGVHILTTAEVKRLQKCNDNKETGFEILEILKTRSVADFIKFCNILKDNEIRIIQTLGLTLENAARKLKQAHGKSCRCTTTYLIESN